MGDEKTVNLDKVIDPFTNTINQLQAELAAAREHHELYRAGADSIVERLEQQLAANDAEIVRLRGALRQYGHHVSKCFTDSSDGKCVCGFEQALK